MSCSKARVSIGSIVDLCDAAFCGEFSDALSASEKLASSSYGKTEVSKICMEELKDVATCEKGCT